MAGIFLSYRRDDSGPYAGRLFDRLCDRFGIQNVFLDVASIPPAVEFFEQICQRIAASDIFLVLIGKQWLRNASGANYFASDADYVRREIEFAYINQIPVIPVLIGQVVMPSFTELPDSIQRLHRTNALLIRHETFSSDFEHLISAIEPFLSAIRSGLSLKLLSRFNVIHPVKSFVYDPSAGNIVTIHGPLSFEAIEWDCKTGASGRRFGPHSDSVNVIALCDGSVSRLIATASLDSTVKIWNRDSAQLQHTLVSHAAGLTALATLSKRQHLLSASCDGAILSWATESPELVKAVQLPRDAGFVSIICSSDSDATIMGTSRGHVFRLSQDHLGLNLIKTFPANIAALATHDSQLIAVACGSKDVGSWLYLQSPEGNGFSEIPLNSRIRCLGFSDSVIVAGTVDGRLQLWSNNGTLMQSIVAHEDMITALSISPNGDRIVAGSSDGTISVWR